MTLDNVANDWMIPISVKIGSEFISEVEIYKAVRNNNGRKALIEDNHEGKFIGTLCYIPNDVRYGLNTGRKIVELEYHDLKELRIIGR